MVKYIYFLIFLKKFILRPDKWIWHGSTTDGLRVSGGFCRDWRSFQSHDTGMASPIKMDRSLTHDSTLVSCARKLIVLCVEVIIILIIKIIFN